MCIIQINFTFVWNKYYNIIMLSIAERHKHILDKLNAQGFVKVLDIARELDVTPVTIRKDLKLLEEKKLLFRTHGSASPVNPHTADINIHIKERINSDAKRRIAHTAIRLLDPNDSIIVASGSTVYAFAEEITDDLNLTVVTASLNVSTLLNRFEHIHVIQLGGTLRKSSFSVIGDLAAQAFDNLTCSKLFMGVDGIDLDFGLTTSNIDEARLNQRMIAASLRTIVLADSSKFEKRIRENLHTRPSRCHHHRLGYFAIGSEKHRGSRNRTNHCINLKSKGNKRGGNVIPAPFVYLRILNSILTKKRPASHDASRSFTNDKCRQLKSYFTTTFPLIKLLPSIRII